MPLLQAYVFGKLRLQCGDKTIDTFPTRHVEHLLGYLLLHQGTPHAREKLIDLLWANDSPANGRASLSTTLWRLRKLFEQLGLEPDCYVQATRDWISFTLESGSYLDAADFEAAVAGVEQSGSDGSCEICLRKALAVYQGPFCEGMYEDWCLLARERLERQHLWASGRLMHLLIERGEYGEAIGVGRRILECDPLREEVHRAIMRCHYRLGQRAQGIRQFQSCANLLQQEMDILPMPETISLYQQIVSESFLQLQKANPQDACQQEIQSAFESFVQAGERLMTLMG